jgi:hypothetical protein
MPSQTLSADELDTLTEAHATGLWAVIQAVEVMVLAHRDEAVTMASLASVPESRHGGAV